MTPWLGKDFETFLSAVRAKEGWWPMFDLQRALFYNNREWKRFPNWVKEEYCLRTGKEIPFEVPDWYDLLESFTLFLLALLGPMAATWFNNRWILHSGEWVTLSSILISTVVGVILATLVVKHDQQNRNSSPDVQFRGWVGSIRQWLSFLPRGSESMWNEKGEAIPKDVLRAEVEQHLSMLGAAVMGYESIRCYEKNPELKERHDEIRRNLMSFCDRASHCILPSDTNGTSFLKLR